MTDLRGSRLLVLLLTAAALVLAGCGPKGEGGQTADGKVPVRLAYFPNVTHAVALVGTGRGDFAKALGPNATLEEQAYNAGPAEIEALFGDQVDIGYIGPGPALNGYLKSNGRALRIIAGASSGGAALVVRRDAGIVDVKGLAGKRVAVPQVGGTQDISLRHALQQAGLTSTDKGGTVMVLPASNADTLTLFVKKELDAAWVPEPWVSRLVKEGNGRILADERGLWPGREFATTVVIVRREFLERHPALVRRFLEAHVDVVEWVRENPAEARRIAGERILTLTKKKLPDDILATAWTRTDFTYDPLRETVLTFADWSKALGYQGEDRGALNGLFDLKLLNEALAARKRPPVE